MLLNVSRCMMCLDVVVLSSFFTTFRIWDWEGMEWNVQASMLSSIGLLLIVTPLAVAPRLPFFQERVSFAAWEAAVCFVMMWVLLQELIADHVAIKWFGQGYLEANELSELPHRVVVVALSLDGVITAVHLALPLRWSVVVWTDALFVLLFIPWAVVMGRVNGKVDFYCICMLAMLTSAASLGLRSTELKDRMLFSTIANERKLRSEAEFRAELGGSGTTEAPSSDGVSRRSRSVASRESGETGVSSTDTQLLFTRAGNADPSSFVQLEKLGLREQWLIGKDELSVFEEDVLGKGGCGIVVGGAFCKGPIAVKKELNDSKLDNSNLMATINEIRILRHVRHPHIALFHGACIDPVSKDIMLVLERVQGHSLESFITARQWWRPSSPEADLQVLIMQGVIQALIYLHSRRPCVVHGDLKPMNIIIEPRANGDFFPKLLDFGLSRTVTRHARLNGGTPCYVSPEVVQERDYKPRPMADIFSLGRLLFTVASGRRPLARYKPGEIVQALKGGRVHDLAWMPSADLLEKQRPIIERCTTLEQRLRPTASEVHDMLDPLDQATRRGTKLRGSPQRGPLEGPSEGPQEGSLEPIPEAQ